MAIDVLTIASGFNVSSAYTLARGDLPIALVIPRSVNAGDLRIQAAASSGASATNELFGDVQLQLQPGNAYGPFTAFSGGGSMGPVMVGPIGPLPSPFIRLWTTTSQTMTVSFTLMTARYA